MAMVSGTIVEIIGQTSKDNPIMNLPDGFDNASALNLSFKLYGGRLVGISCLNIISFLKANDKF